jgi:hypothetical protein
MNSKFKLEQPIDKMGTSKNPQQTRKKNKMGGHESKPFMIHLEWMEIDD